jgi:hypothetical protein
MDDADVAIFKIQHAPQHIFNIQAFCHSLIVSS